ncbi:calcium-binding protein [Cognatishimia sp. F0-27]|uniref:calcium-binding protein n=1 Tax=Cognatishimia sp. F0-27 TaxID=2816855 RepID=UPI001D0C9F34|nr:calcium-binding protein [Cognatishimia sp. F0-27]MCC1493628.1 hypothetical protein [Cognatishimia sp. F0-27]
MADFSIATNSTLARTLSGEDGFIGTNGGLSVDGDHAVTVSGSGGTLTVLGYLNAYNGAFSAVNVDAVSFSMTVGPLATVSAAAASGGVLNIDVLNLARLVNHGSILATGFRAVVMDPTDTAASMSLTNHGTISSVSSNAVDINSGLSSNYLTNTGVISSNSTTVRLEQTSSSSAVMEVVNTGTVISTASYGFDLISSNISPRLTFTNSGTVIGDDAGVQASRDGGAEITNTGLIDGNLRSIFSGDGDDHIINAGQVIGNIVTSGGADTIDMRGGTLNGMLEGGDGADLYIVDDDTIEIAENTAEGTDTVRSSVSFRLFDADVEALELTGETATRGVGNAGDNEITGNARDNDLHGFEGSDTMAGGAGVDRLFGSAGNDFLFGGPGDDWLHGGADNDNLQGADGEDLLQGGTGDDAVFGGPGNDTIEGGTGNDTIYDAEGDDTLIGGTGNDVFVAGDGADTMRGEEGNDTVFYVLSPARVAVNLGVSFFQGGFADGDRGSGIENLSGSPFDDILVGNALANRIEATGGANTLRGEAGNDTLVSNAGPDLLDGGPGADLASYTGSGARVIINLEIGYAAGGYAAGDTLISIEQVQGTPLNDRIVGSNSGNRLFGEGGSDELNGAGARDLLYGGPGNDTLIGGTGNDVFVFAPGWDNDRITDFEDGADRLDVSALPGINAPGDLNFLDIGADLRIDAGGADTILLAGMAGTTLTSADFIF